MVLLPHIVFTSCQQSWLTSSLTVLLFWTKLMKILWKSLHGYYTYINVLPSAAPFTVLERSLTAWAENACWCCLNGRLKMDLRTLCSSPPHHHHPPVHASFACVTHCHLPRPCIHDVSVKYSNYRRERQGPAQSQITVINDPSGIGPIIFICALLVGVCILWMPLLDPCRIFAICGESWLIIYSAVYSKMNIFLNVSQNLLF